MPDWRGRNISCLLYLRHDLHVNPLLCVSPFAQNKVTSRSSVARRAEAIKTRGSQCNYTLSSFTGRKFVYNFGIIGPHTHSKHKTTAGIIIFFCFPGHRKVLLCVCLIWHCVHAWFRYDSFHPKTE